MSQTELPLNQFIPVAQTLIVAGKRWHFHILTPGCKLNDAADFVLLLESTTDEEIYAAHSDTKPTEVGKKLVEMLHGKSITSKEKASGDQVVSPAIQQIVRRAAELNAQSKPWHHHMLFPDCTFNGSGRWKILFEDPDTGQILESLSSDEPKADLKQIETLFYQQKP